MLTIVSLVNTQEPNTLIITSLLGDYFKQMIRQR